MESAFGVDHGEVSKGLPRAVRNLPGRGYSGLLSAEKKSSDMNRAELATFYRARSNRLGHIAGKLKAKGDPRWEKIKTAGHDDRFASRIWGA